MQSQRSAIDLVGKSARRVRPGRAIFIVSSARGAARLALVLVVLAAAPRQAPAQRITRIIDGTGDGAGNTLSAPFGVAVDGAANVYVAGNGSDNAFKITPAGVITEIIDANGDGAGNGLDNARAIAVDGAGNVLVAGLLSDNAFKITPSGVITQIIDANGDGAGNTFSFPQGIAADGAGDVYVTGSFSDNAFKITPSGVITQIIDANGDGAGNTLNDPFAVAVDGAGNVYVGGGLSANVFMITPAGAIIEIMDAGPGHNISFPRCIAVDGAANVYVPGEGTNNAFEITPAGAITSIIDATGDGEGNALQNPVGIALDSAGNVYVTGRSSANAFKITSAGVIKQIIDFTGDGAGNTLSFPQGIAVDGAGNVYISSLNNSSIFKITPCGDGIVDTAFGESCDDGGAVAGDGCSSTCTVEPGFVCTGQPSVCGPEPEKIYWADTGVPKAIKRANLDGTGLEVLIDSGHVGAQARGIFIDTLNDTLYFSRSVNPAILRAGLDGTNIQTIITLEVDFLGTIAVDVIGGRIYWMVSSPPKIQRASLDGTNLQDLVIGGGGANNSLFGGLALHVAAGKMYWSDNNAGIIHRANLDGSDVENVLVGVQAQDIALDLNAGKTYFGTNGAVSRANLDGSALETLVTGVNATGVVLDIEDGKLYWSDTVLNVIQVANLDGSGVANVITSGTGQPGDLALELPGPTCRNGILDPGEQCDGGLGCSDCLCDLGFEPTTAPSVDCLLKCGNGRIDPGEACDDGNTADCDGCRGDCSAVEGACGDGLLDPTCEVCDDGNNADCDVCRGDCSAVEGTCGDGTLDPTCEVCDDGNNGDCDGCRGDCSAVEGTCGDGTLDPTCEVCDDGNTADCDGCRGDCSVLDGTCGDGMVDPVCEGCDDENTADRDGCSSSCTVEPGFVCMGEPSVCQPDCNGNGVPDADDIVSLTSPDCDLDGVPDECQIDVNSTAVGGPFFCTADCDPDCNNTGIPDACELVGNDCNTNGVPDECDVEQFVFSDFSSLAGLNLVGNTTTVGSRLRLTTEACLQRGGVWFTDKQFVQGGFDTTFLIEISRDGADGLAFLIQNESESSLGSRGGGLGYTNGDFPGIANSVAIEFDTFLNVAHGDPNDNHVSIHTAGLAPNEADESFSLGSSTAIPFLSDAAPHTVRILYIPGTLSIFVDDLVNPALVAAVDLASILSLDNGTAWVGFTAATGLCVIENHDILSWSFKSSALVDCNANGIPDECELVGNDCNANGIPDECDLSNGTSLDCNANGILDECDVCVGPGARSVYSPEALLDLAQDWKAARGGSPGGPVLIGGDDADDHGSVSAGVNLSGWLYIEEGFNLIGPEVGNVNRVAVCLGCNGDLASGGFEFGFDLSNLPGAGWTRQTVTGNADIEAFFAGTNTTVNVADAGIVYMPTDFGNVGGGITSGEIDAVNANAAAINGFVSAGGGLFTHSQQFIPGGFGWLQTLLPGLVVNSAGACNEGLLNLTAVGTLAFPNLTDAIVSDATPWHNWFSGDLGGLQSLVTGPCGANNEPVIIGGGNVQIQQSIDLTPVAADNPLFTPHTVFAEVSDTAGALLSGVTVTFEVIAGPNLGATGADVTDINGVATFTYVGAGGPGIDEIIASFTDDNQQLQTSNTAFKTWIEPPCSLDCNTNGIPDDCDLADGVGEDCNINGIPDSCEGISPSNMPLPDLIQAKNRYLSFSAGEIGQNQAVRVTLRNLPGPQALLNGTVMWVGPPTQVSELSGKDDATPPTFMVATLRCLPHFMDWSTVGVVHVSHQRVVPDGVYDIQVVDEHCDAGSEAGFSLPLTVINSMWGDVVGPFDGDAGVWTAPDGTASIAFDVVAILDKFKNAPTAPRKSRTDIQPNPVDGKVSIVDVTRALDAFSGAQFPFDSIDVEPCG